MGYIAPVNHYQYKDYQQRTIQTERSPFALEQVFKATLDSKLEQHDQHKEQDRKDYQEMTERLLYTPHSLHVAHNKNEKQWKAKETIYSDLTGKGQHFSETV
ncbi:hypothetical protein H0266_06025 [Halobacillus locisalis]|uniref:Uncharacterized protein n=1 Tax=Halobacillus locisalis TaxID=220753 RepID=A0A838CQR4_9BACI|nr:hypothetical protein [Halobacillus locisalis]MBA2174462.1 hypothetical protein [Halobacillus locisalis]